jgi:hypothetical protein
MHDHYGLYYYPSAGNRRVRMYVREEGGEVFFRLWNADDPKLWEDHGWVPHGAIRQAAAIYAGKDFDPLQAYDLELARALLAENAAPPGS